MFDIIALFIVSLLLYVAPIALFPLGCNWISLKKRAKLSGITFKKALTTDDGLWVIFASVISWGFATWIIIDNISTI